VARRVLLGVDGISDFNGLHSRRHGLSDLDPFNKVDAALHEICWLPKVVGPIHLPRFRFFVGLKRSLESIIRDRHGRRHLPVHNVRGRRGTEIDGYEQRFRIVEGVKDGGRSHGLGLIRGRGRNDERGFKHGVLYCCSIFDGIVQVLTHSLIGLRDIDSVYREADRGGAKSKADLPAAPGKRSRLEPLHQTVARPSGSFWEGELTRIKRIDERQ
jgi:hypothetical protein